MRIASIIVSLLLILSATELFGQAEVPVNMYSGRPIIGVPLWTLQEHDITYPVGLSYNSGGIKITDSNGPFGVGWSLQGAGSISREVRGLPDDFKGTSPDTRSGWLYTGATSVYSFAGASDVSTTCPNTDETTDYNAINGFNYKVDTEPDIFYVNTPDFSFRFFYDNAQAIHLVPFQDIKIDPTYAGGTDKTITGFVITSNNGNKYTFNTLVTVDRWTEPFASSAVEFLKRDYEFYNKAANNSIKVHHTVRWMLTRIDSPSGAFIDFTYLSQVIPTLSDTVKVSIRKYATSDFVEKPVYTNRTDLTDQHISQITGSAGQKIFVTYNSTFTTCTNIQVRDARKSSTSSFKSFSFEFASRLCGNWNSGYYRSFLTRVVEAASDCEKTPGYRFTYFQSEGGYSTMPTEYSNNCDLWGYSNGAVNATIYPKIYVYPNYSSPIERYRYYPFTGYGGQEIIIAGANRMPNLSFAKTGSLQSMTTPIGGTTTFEYELNQFYDSATSQTLNGGGIRVKKITYYDGFDQTINIVKNFNYDQSVGVTSGRLISKPAFAIPVSEYRDPDGTTTLSYSSLVTAGNTQNLWEYLTVRSRNDISSGETTNGDAIGYKVVTVSRTGAGAAKYFYDVPGVYGETTRKKFTATTIKPVRSSACPSLGVISGGGTWMYPYANQGEDDFERGLVTLKQEFNEAGTKVRETVYAYQYLYMTGTTPTLIQGLKYEHYTFNSNAFLFGKYAIPTDVARVLSKITETVYDENSAGKNSTSSVEYLHNGTNHKLVTTILSTGPDGTIYKTLTKYPLDYGTITSPSGKPATMIKNLQTTFRNNTAIEEKKTIQLSGGSERISSASMITFDDFSLSGMILPAKTYNLPLTAPATSFTDSYINGSGVFTFDSRYENTSSVVGYDNFMQPLTTTDQGNQKASVFWGYSNTAPVVTAKNVAYNEFAFSDFETVTGHEFQLSSSVVGAGRTGTNGLYPQVQLTATLQKVNYINNYVVSFWLKKLSASVDFTIDIKTVGLSLISSTTFTASPSGSDYQLFTKSISAAAFPSTFVVVIKSSLTGTLPSSSPTLLPMIDDVAFYPENAELTSYTYAMPFGVATITSPSGITSNNVYDGFGRLKYTLDQQKNITSRTKYASWQGSSGLSGAITLPEKLLDETLLYFNADGNSCVEGETYEWDFGSGFVSSGTNSYASYTYTSIGSKTVTVRVSHPDYAQVTTSTTFLVEYKPIDVQFCVKGVVQYNLCDNSMVLSSCPAITYPVTTTAAHPQTAMHVTHDRGAEVVQYEWMHRAAGDLWFYFSSPEPTTDLLQELQPTGRRTVEYQCTITTSYGRTGTATFVVPVTSCN